MEVSLFSTATTKRCLGTVNTGGRGDGDAAEHLHHPGAHARERHAPPRRGRHEARDALAFGGRLLMGSLLYPEKASPTSRPLPIPTLALG